MLSSEIMVIAMTGASGFVGRVVAPLLVGIGDVTAGQALVNWLQSTAEDAAPLLRDYLVRETRTPAMWAAWQAALDPEVPFRQEGNREAIRSGIAAHEAGIRHELR